MRGMRGVSVLAVTAVALVAASAPTAATDSAAATDDARGSSVAAKASSSEIVVVSSRPDHITGGDAVIRVDVPDTVSLNAVTVLLNDVDVTASFREDVGDHELVGLVSGLRDGKNVLSAKAKTSQTPFSARVTVRNSPTYGPLFSGPHQRPWICETLASGLGAPPESGPCVAPTRYDWFYRATAGQFAPYDASNPPSDVAQTTTIDGETVDYIVRVESGTINESIYRIAIIADPAQPPASQDCP